MGVDVCVLIKKSSLKRLLRKEVANIDFRFLDEIDSLRFNGCDSLEDLLKLKGEKDRYTSLDLLSALRKTEMDDFEDKERWKNILEYDLIFMADSCDSDEFDKLEKEGYIRIIDLFEKIAWFASFNLDKIIKMDVDNLADQPQYFN